MRVKYINIRIALKLLTSYDKANRLNVDQGEVISSTSIENALANLNKQRVKDLRLSHEYNSEDSFTDINTMSE